MTINVTHFRPKCVKALAGLYEFMRIFSQDDIIRMLVDLLKLAVAARCNDKGMEAVATLLQNMGESIAGLAEMLLVS